MSEQTKWRYYNHALLPQSAPHEHIDISTVKKELKDSRALFARWTSNFDTSHETAWWWCIKDDQFDISKLDSKKRYCITRGKREFDIRKINPHEFKDELFEVQKAAYMAYPLEYRPSADRALFDEEIQEWNGCLVFAAFKKESGEIGGYAVIKEYEKWADFQIEKTKPEFERLHINAALVAFICEYYNCKLGNNFYIADGERNISHVTGFQSYLEKYFGFRKAYCTLNIKYRFSVACVVKCLFICRKCITHFKEHKLVYPIYCVLKMEEIVRRFAKEEHS